MLKINKCITLSRRIPQISWFSSHMHEKQCPPRYECKHKEEESDHEREAAHLKESSIPKLFRPVPHKDERIFRNIFFFICLPAILLTYINVFYLSERECKRPKFVEYSYLRIRNKPFPWDPDRTLFHNPEKNAISTGYEVEYPEENELDPMDIYPCPVPKRNGMPGRG